jgi:hypothetical protein
MARSVTFFGVSAPGAVAGGGLPLDELELALLDELELELELDELSPELEELAPELDELGLGGKGGP